MDFFLTFIYTFFGVLGLLWYFTDQKKTSLPSLRSSCRRRADLVAFWWIGRLLGGLEGGPCRGNCETCAVMARNTSYKY